MQLSMSIEEAQDLKLALDAYAPELEFELARTERHDAQHALHLRLDRLQAIRSRLAQLLAEPAAQVM